MNLNKSSAWTQSGIRSFLKSSTIPLRIATSAGEFPTLCSVWYIYDEASEDLLCVSHQNSQLVAELRTNPRCAFEIAPNTPPYFGVRGKALVTLTKTNAPETLAALIQRYLGNSDSRLAQWLLGRSEDEYLLRLTSVKLTSWDYRERMD